MQISVSFSSFFKKKIIFTDMSKTFFLNNLIYQVELNYTTLTEQLLL